MQAKWFWGYMNRGDSEKKLYNEGKIGDFIVRLNSDRQLVISLWYAHMRVVSRDSSACALALTYEMAQNCQMLQLDVLMSVFDIMI